MSLGRRGPGGRRRFPKRLNAAHALPRWRFSRLGADRLPARRAQASTPRVRQRSEAVDVDRGQLVGRGLKDVAIVMRLDELAPVGGWPPGGRDWTEGSQPPHPRRPSSAPTPTYIGASAEPVLSLL